MSLSSPLILFASAVTSASAFSSSAPCSSDYCKKSGLYFLPEAECLIVVPVKLSCMSSMTFSFEKSSVSRGFNFE